MKFSEMFKSEQRPESGKKYCGWVQKHLTLHSALNCQAELTNGFGIFSLSQVRAYRGLEPIKNQNNPIIINSLAQITIHYPVMCGNGNAQSTDSINRLNQPTQPSLCQCYDETGAPDDGKLLLHRR
jgi:hypothetical protein